MRWWFLRNWWVILGGVYLLSRGVGLTLLPVFADEAIYIRWAQMINNDPQQHLFLPLYDGKTPLYMWILSQLLPLARAYPVLLGRILSMAAGLGTAMILSKITRKLEGGIFAQIAAFSLYLLLPYAFFHDRMALTDGLFVFFLSLTFWALLQLKGQRSFMWLIWAGIVFGLSLVTKLPAIIFLVHFGLILWLMPPFLYNRDHWKAVMMFLAAAIMGMLILFSLRISPLFPFLFQRGSDFTYTLADYFSCEGAHCGLNLQPLWGNLTRLVRWQGWYSTLGLWFGLISWQIIRWYKSSKIPGLSLRLVVMALLFGGYFVVGGKIFYSRYLLPMLIFLIPAGALSLEGLWKLKQRAVFLVAVGLILVQSIWFMYPLWTNAYTVRLPEEDIEQYLTEWSSGFGNREVADYLAQEAQRAPIAVATEGFFGTLPDGLSIYFDGSPVNDRVEIFGIGQPVTSLSQEVWDRSLIKDTYLVVNESRMKIPVDSCCQLITRYSRPYNGSDLLLLKVRPR